MTTSQSKSQQQLICTLALVTMITHIFGLIQPSLAATSTSQQQTENAAASTQPLWSYQVKPTNYINAGQNGQSAPYSTGHSSIFDAFTGLNQRQGALTGGGSPLLSILPIILIAAGGLLLLLPMLTMMMASPFGGGPFGGGGYQNYGYPQVGLNKRRSLDQASGGGSRGIIELIEHVSSTIEDLSRKYSANGQQQANGSSAGQSAGGAQALNKRSKALNGAGGSATAHNHHQGTTNPNESSQAQPANHKPSTAEMADLVNNVNNLITPS